jgi:hypothetical protein
MKNLTTLQKSLSFRKNRFFQAFGREKCDFIRNPIWLFLQKEPNGIPHKFSFAPLCGSKRKFCGMTPLKFDQRFIEGHVGSFCLRRGRQLLPQIPSNSSADVSTEALAKVEALVLRSPKDEAGGGGG